MDFDDDDPPWVIKVAGDVTPTDDDPPWMIKVFGDAVTPELEDFIGKAARSTHPVVTLHFEQDVVHVSALRSVTESALSQGVELRIAPTRE